MKIEILLALTTLISLVAAVMAWVSKLLWAKEYRLAKDELEKALRERIALLESQVKASEELSPVKMRERFIAIKDSLEEYVENLESEIDRLKNGSITESSGLNKIQVLEKEKAKAIRQEEVVIELVEKLPSAFDKIKYMSLPYKTADRDPEYVKYFVEDR